MADTLDTSTQQQALESKLQFIRSEMTKDAAFDGKPANLVTLQNKSNMSITLMDIGATWLSCILPIDDVVAAAAGDTNADRSASDLTRERSVGREVLLGTSNITDFQNMSAYMGVTAGRYANRIANGQFEIDGEKYQLLTNQGAHTLHGGPEGFNKRRWQIADQGASYVTFSLVSPDGDQGFPGELTASVTYSLNDDNQVVIDYRGSTSKPTPVNLTNHAYFNLMGEASETDCMIYTLQINAEHYLPTNSEGIPLGAFEPVANSSFDFRQAKRVGKDLLKEPQQEAPKGYDHSFILNPECKQGEYAAIVTTPDNRVCMKVFTDKPAVQLYTGNWLAGATNRAGGEYQDYAGIALETQYLPDAPNHPEWEQPSSILRPEQQYSYQTIYQFEF